MPVAAYAQDASTGALNGVVVDASGGAVVGSRMVLRNVATGEERVLNSDRLGEFLFSQLAPGIYRLIATANGFNALQMDTVVVTVGHTTRLRPQLVVGGVAQTVEVTAEDLPGFDSPVNADLDPQQMQELPLDGRRFQTLAVLTPLVSGEDAGVVLNPDEESDPGAGGGDTDNAQLAVRGQDPALNRFTLNGADNTRRFDMQPMGGGTLPFTIAQEAVQEFTVRAVQAGIDAQGAGGAVHTVTRRGGDKVHGSAFFLIRNSAANAANPFSTVTRYNGGSPVAAFVKPRDQREQFGGAIGGPLWKGLHGFVAVEEQRRSFPAISTPSDASFYALTDVQKALLANRGVGSAAIAKGLAYIDSLSGPVGRWANEISLYPRVDWDTRGGNVSVDWNHVRFSSPAGSSALPVVARGRGSLASVVTHDDDVRLRVSRQLGRRWMVDARGAYRRDSTYTEWPAPLPQEPHTGPGGTSPQVNLSGAFSFGGGPLPSLRRLPDERTVEAAATLHFEGHAHNVSLGASLVNVDERIAGQQENNGLYSYTARTTAGHAGALVDFLTDYTYDASAYPNGGCPSVYTQPHYFCFTSYSQSFGPTGDTRFRTSQMSASVQDRWRPTTRLRIVAGVRYEWNRLPPPQHPNAALDAAFGDFASTTTMPSDTNNLAPHVGVSYAPVSGTVIRVGYGFAFSEIPGSTLQRALANTAQTMSQTQLRMTPRTLVDAACSSAGTNFGYPATYVCAPFGPVARTGAAWMFARSFQMPTVQTAEVSLSQQIARRTQLSWSYVLGLSRQLTNTVDLNIAPATSNVAFRIVRNGGEPGALGGQVFHVPLYAARRTDAFGTVTGLVSSGNGIYNAMAWELSHRTQRSFTLRAKWTFSKSIDTMRTGPVASNENARFDPFQPLYDRAASNFDHRHRVTATMVWQPQVYRGESWMRHVANGWSLAPILLMQSGRPYSYNLSGGTALNGGRESLNGSGGANYLPTLGRNTLRLPWTESIDVRLSRAFRVTRDRAMLRLTGEVFNLLNHVNVTTVEQRAFLVGAAGTDGIVPLTFQDAPTIAAEGLTSDPFGTWKTSANSPMRERRLQVGLRMEW